MVTQQILKDSKSLQKKKDKDNRGLCSSIWCRIQKKESWDKRYFACFSFHAQKNITTLGRVVLYGSKIINLPKVKGLRHNGHCDFKKENFIGNQQWGNLDLDLKNKWPYKFTLSEIQCAAGITMLKKLDKLNQIRINRANILIKKLSKFKELSF